MAKGSKHDKHDSGEVTRQRAPDVDVDPQAAEIAALSYEGALEELEELIGRVEDGSLALEEGIRAHRRAVLLLRHCESILNAAQAQIEQISGRDLPESSDEGG